MEVFQQPRLNEAIVRLSSGKLFTGVKEVESLNAHYRCLKMINVLLINGSQELIYRIIFDLKEMKVLSAVMSCAGGGSDIDDIISASIECLHVLLINKVNSQISIVIKNFMNRMKEEMELEGMSEDNDTFLYHTDARIGGVVFLAKQMKAELKQ
ncbi:MAG: hypothetical protein EZS28_037610 [Streblomastix strix]|uniref:Uncharacterized protein n=1 Tax=Streblomastix strix TaxID=222440 RepID=A0A5J4U9J3_9EUKA|nr:MAG: hypothetical protein EZS28_037610 [Streblomastix strix]